MKQNKHRLKRGVSHLHNARYLWTLTVNLKCFGQLSHVCQYCFFSIHCVARVLGASLLYKCPASRGCYMGQHGLLVYLYSKTNISSNNITQSACSELNIFNTNIIK